MSITDIVQIENTEFVRDMGNKAVLNTDRVGLSRYKEGRRKAIQAKREAIETKTRLDSIEKEMSVLKKILSELKQGK